ncbi:MAG: glutamine--fructose-6-phosphate transaminase (isomerizing) [Candidatus Promineifilaceae bacterium]
MCGIVGYIGARQAADVILSGLKRLEYRGYDSAGLAVVHENGSVSVRREAGKLDGLINMVRNNPVHGEVGIGHTRWATHGPPNRTNAHPHTSMNGRIVVVQNGIVENYLTLKEELQADGVVFVSDTDTEVIAHLAERFYDASGDFVTAARQTLAQLQGSNAVVMFSPDNPEVLVCARLGNAGGITLGLGEDEMFIASDIPAILDYTREVIFLESGQMAVVNRNEYVVTSLNGDVLAHEVHKIAWDPVSAAKGQYKHFMQKEIAEQPRALIDTMRGRIDFDSGEVTLPNMNLTAELANKISKIYTVACGTSYLSGLVGKFLIESIARVPVEVEFGSEFRYYDPIIDDTVAVLGITQSGETADTLAAVEQAREQGATIWSIVNAYGSQAMRTADGYIAMQAGPEIAVASTKVFTTSIVDQFMLAVKLGELRGVISAEKRKALLTDLAHLPDLAGQVLDNEAQYEDLSKTFHRASNFLFIGRGINYPIALEGALKLKEISYIHAEGYPAGEMKHGPIALIDETMPVVAIVPEHDLYDKMISQVQQSKARGGKVIAIATEGDKRIENEADHVIFVPKTSKQLQPILNVIPLQLLSYQIALWRGCDVDQPRNLAKSVTVE